VNVARAIELAYAQTLREYAELGAGCAVRAWQSLRNDPTWDVEKDRTFPMVDVRVSAPRFDDNAHTMYCEAAVLCGTKTDDDIDHAAIQSLYGAVQGVCDLLYAQFRADLLQVGADDRAWRIIPLRRVHVRGRPSTLRQFWRQYDWHFHAGAFQPDGFLAN